MIKCITLDREFDTQLEMFKALKEAKKDILNLKMSKTYKSIHKGVLSTSFYAPGTTKAVQGLEAGFIYPIISNTKYMDSHMDVHMDNSMNRTVDHQQGKVYYAVNHDLSIGKIIAYPRDVEMMLKDIAWSDIGKDFPGTTQALMFKTKTFEYSNKDAVGAIENKAPVQNSIRMQYKDMAMAINSMDDDFAAEKAEWDENIEKIVNKEVAIEAGYFFPVKELSIEREGSMVIQGSNDATPIIIPNPSKDTSENGSSKDTQTPAEDSQTKFYQNLIS